MAVSSRIAAVAAVVGALIGCFTAYVLGVTPSDIGMGLWGYNPVLCMIALGGLAPIIFDWRKAVLAIYGSVFCTVFVGAFLTLLAPVGSLIDMAFLLCDNPFCWCSAILRRDCFAPSGYF